MCRTAKDRLDVDSAGNLFAATDNGTIVEITPGGVFSVFANNNSGLVLSGPIGLAFDSEGNLYAANHNTSTIEEFTPGGVGSVFASSLSSPTGIVFVSNQEPSVSNAPEPSTWALFAISGAALLIARWRKSPERPVFGGYWFRAQFVPGSGCWKPYSSLLDGDGVASPNTAPSRR
jgi:secreted PhoX family phosphatase